MEIMEHGVFCFSYWLEFADRFSACGLGAMIESMWLGKILAYIGKNTVVILIFHIFILQSTEVIAEKIMELPPPESGWNLCYQIVRITVAIVLCLLLNRCLEYGKKVCMNKKKIRGDET